MTVETIIKASFELTQDQYDALNNAEIDGITPEILESLKTLTTEVEKSFKLEYKGGTSAVSRNLTINAIANVLRKNGWFEMLLITMGMHKEMAEKTIKRLEQNN